MAKNLVAALLFAATAASPALAGTTLPNLPPGPLGAAIQRGHDMMMSSASPEVKPYIGNALACSSCHLNAGDTAAPGNFRFTATKLPAFSPREGVVITLEDRIANCFMRSMNGMRPGTDSPVIVDMAAYITWLDRTKPIYGPLPAAPKSPFPAMLKTASADTVKAGATVYSTNCAACHGATGQGVPGSFPPLWGPNSYNAGAGLANIAKLATWVKGNMPLGNPHLTPTQAFDVALYIDSHARPDFTLSQHLPAGMPPGDYNAAVREEHDTTASDLKKAGLTLPVIASP
ncbi:c-type cytochrome [Acidocella sp.]|uniref:c-type cytochrome n=1 Tax=Acidocella sp. TaxID=50710 RepID=UPI00263901D5|nr:c-type cytochrome [Acidocella sp.]